MKVSNQRREWAGWGGQVGMRLDIDNEHDWSDNELKLINTHQQ